MKYYAVTKIMYNYISWHRKIFTTYKQSYKHYIIKPFWFFKKSELFKIHIACSHEYVLLVKLERKQQMSLKMKKKVRRRNIDTKSKECLYHG